MITEALPDTEKISPGHVLKLGVIFKTHLDLGFTALANEVFRRYMTDFMPRATHLALAMAQDARTSRGPDERFIWTTGSWLVSKYLDYSRGRARRDFEKAISDGLIRWHALPFTFQTEALDESLLDAALAISQRLDARFGVRTLAAKMTDVPGHTRGMIPALAAAGVKLLHIGVNPASTPPDVPPLFRWRHPSGAEIIVCYEDTYGGFCAIPGGDGVFALAMTGDNAGPPADSVVRGIYSSMRERFPLATVRACTLEEMAASVVSARDQLPCITDEIGDTWIHGYGSDPWKMAAYRSLARLRGGWLRQGRFDPQSRRGIGFDENLLLALEHTWGLDEKTWLHNGEPLKKLEGFFRRADFQRARRRPDFQRMEASWKEQREYVHQAVSALGSKSLRAEASAAIADIDPPRTYSRTGLRPMDARKARLGIGRQACSLRSDGALCISGVASAFLGALNYEVFGAADYVRFQRQYLTEPENTGIWAPMDFGKPGLAKVLQRGRSWKPQVIRVSTAAGCGRMVIDSAFPAEAARDFGAPLRLRTVVTLEEDGAIAFDLQWFDKPATRIPEALWFSFRPPVGPDARWLLHKLGGAVDPLDVVRNGSRHLHIVQDGVTAEDSSGRWHFSSPDAALVAPGKPSLLDFNNEQPDPTADGIHFNLFNNIWGTNFPMWYDDDARFRFKVRHSIPVAR
jgi:Domain of unknown function (DUF5054)